jgi:hypothetical protein
MIKHTAIQAGIGIGLMAASFGASADLHTFGQPAVYYKINGAAVNYTAFLPSGSSATDSPIMLDMLQSGTVSTWAYAMGGVLGVLSPGSTATGTFSTGASSTCGIYYHSNAAGGLAWRATGVLTSLALAGGTSTVSVSTYFGGDTQALSLSFLQTPTISSQACNMSFYAKLDSDDYLQFTNVTVRPDNWPSATDSVSYRTKSGTTASDTASIASAAFNAYNAASTSSFYTFSAWSVPVAGAAANTVAVSLLSAPFGKCNTAATNRTASNAAGNIIGGKGGMMRLW